MSLVGIIESIVSDVLFWLMTAAVGWILLVLTRRTRLLEFFGARKSRRIVIYLSNLRIVRGGAIGIDGCRRNYEGAAAPFLETKVANRFRNLFNYLFPSFSGKPGVLSKLLISDVQVQLEHSPLREEEVENSSSLIAVGSPAYNVAAKFIESNLDSQARVRLGRKDLSPGKGSRVGKVVVGIDSSGEFAPRSKASSASDDDQSMSTGMGTAPLFEASYEEPAADAEPELSVEPRDIPSAILVEDVSPIVGQDRGFVERVVDQRRDRVAFYVAGISEIATAGAAHFLMTEWRYLDKKYPNSKPFLVVLRFDMNDYKRWSIVFEK
jgi:hypothetical protein